MLYTAIAEAMMVAFGTASSSFHFEEVSVRSRFENCSTELMFKDVDETDYYYDAVVWALENGIIEGENWMLEPSSNVSRARIVRILWRLADRPGNIVYGSDSKKEEQIVTGFTDVPGSVPYATAVVWAVNNEITDGISDTEFAPEAFCTRGEIITFLYRYAGSPEVTVGNIDTIFTDVDVDEYYAPAVRWAYDNGIIKGKENKILGVIDICTKAEVIEMIYRYAN